MKRIAFEEELSRRIAEARPGMLFRGSTRDELAAWQATFRETLIGLLGERPTRAALELEVGEPISTFIYSKSDWETLHVHSPLYKSIKKEGIHIA